MLLAEELLLLVYDDDTGRQEWASNVDYALAGAVLIELTDLGHVDLDGEGRKARLAVRDTASTGHPVLDQWQAKVAEQDGREPKDVVSKLVDKADRKVAKQRAKEIAEGNWASEATRKAVQEMTAVVVSVAIMPAIMAGGASGN